MALDQVFAPRLPFIAQEEVIAKIQFRFSLFADFVDSRLVGFGLEDVVRSGDEGGLEFLG